jgi:hypothetical protein
MKPISGKGQMANLDRILASEEELAPSSGFVASVMERVREEAAAPQPIPFPWKRALPGMILAFAGLVWCIVKLVQLGIAAASTPTPARLHPGASVIHSAEGAGWTVAALGVSLLSWLLARRMVGRGGLI